MSPLPPLLVAFLFSASLSAVVRFLAPRLSLLDQPRADRWHRRPIPRFGGVAVFATFLLTFALFRPPSLSGPLIGILIGFAAIFLVGLIDDIYRLENRPKLVLMVLAVCVPALFGVRFGTFPPIIGVPLAIIWILGATNALNWLDNMDGLAGGVTAIAAGTLVLLGLHSNGVPLLLALILLGVSLGFLVHNFPPARLFMGDAGSGFLGFALAATATLGSSQQVGNVLLALLAPGLILAVPIFDSITVTVLRVINGRSVFLGGRDHPSHRLVAFGIPERRAVVLLYGLSLLSGGVGLLAWRLGPLSGLAISVLLGLGFVALGIVLAEVRTYDEPPATATRLPGPLMNKRWLASIGLDLILLCVAYVGAQLLRFEGTLPKTIADAVARALPLVLAAKMVVLYLFGVYRGEWRYAGILDLIRLAQAATVGSLVAVAGVFLWTGLVGLSRAALVLDWMLTMGLLILARIGLRAVREYLSAIREAGNRVLIAGVGPESARLANALRAAPELGYVPVGFIGEDGGHRGGLVLQGLRVLGGLTDIPSLVRRHRVQAVIIVPPDLNGAEDQVRSLCQQAGVGVRRSGRLIE